ncbi:RICIN domain-containing protein [Kibdelosporangium philippinense]|uniref:RICIN domain-containing protein n=1 Tax=Kibdelosporangium philippinense TaxID=211113 RepID=A0ABS8ZQ89_9PSEU|nr:RICIN domain-containing protein [Kibdelosporangium philippinense]MCE7007962.1 RICIN domain-containing protein [Kibdelosporangium philippinense]
MYTFWNLHNKNCLNMWAAVMGDWGQFTEGECAAGAHQRFARIVDAPSGMFLLQVQHSGKFMSVPTGNNSLNAIMTQYSDQAKLFYLERA